VIAARRLRRPFAPCTAPLQVDLHLKPRVKWGTPCPQH
jgi:hypothetical protein